MALFDRIGNRIRKIFTPREERQILQPKEEPKPTWLQKIQNFFKPKEEPQIAEPVAAPEPPMPSYISAEMGALRQATDILIQSEMHPDDATWRAARNAALLYINKSQKLADKGATQTGNRRGVAERYMENELSTPAGVEQRKADKLRVFNSNFGFDLSMEQADTVGKLMESASFQKLMETYKERYDILIGMIGDQIEQGIDPIRVESAINFWQTYNLEPDFADFAKVTELSTEDYNAMLEEAALYREESSHGDEIEDTAAIYGIMGGFITW